MTNSLRVKHSRLEKKSTYGGLLLALASYCLCFILSNPIQEPLPSLTQGKRVSIPFTLWAEKNGQEFYYSEIAGGGVYVAKEGISYQIVSDKDGESPQSPRPSYALAMNSRGESTFAQSTGKSSLVFREEFNSALSVTGLETASTRMSRFQSSVPTDWQTNGAAYDSLSLGKPWPGIEVELRAYSRNVEKLFKVSPGADPQAIHVSCSGIENLKVLESGELLLETALGPIKLTKPIAYQENTDESQSRTNIEVAYLLKENNSYGFAISKYDSTRELIIDPLLASTFVGGTADERYAYDDFAGHIYTGHPSIVEDSAGNIIVVGQTRSPDYPTTLGVIDSTYNDATSVLKNDIVVTKLSADLSTVLASTYLGGTSEDNGASLAIAPDGSIYVLGFTRSRDFPVTNIAFDITYGGGNADAFIALLSPDLTTLLASTYIGGSGNDYLYGLTIASDDSLYLVGDTSSSRFPTRPGGFNLTRSGSTDAFVLQMTPELTAVTAGTLLGGAGYDYGRMVSLTPSGSVMVLGNTTSSDFPTTAGAFDETANGEHDIFLSVLNGTLDSLERSTYLGGSLDDIASSLVTLSDGKIAIAGSTLSINFPTVATGYDKTHNGANDGLIALVADDLSALQGVTFVGGSNWDDIYEIKAGPGDVLYLGGWTQSANLPVAEESYDTTLSGASDAFLAKFSSDLATRLSLTYLGGSGNVDYILSLLLAQSGDLVTLGITDSADFPSLSGAQNTLSGGRDTFVAKITANLLADSFADHLLVRDDLGNPSASTPTGTPVVVRIEARDDLDRVVTSYSGNKTVVFSGPTVSPGGMLPTCTNNTADDVPLGSNTTLTFTNGIASCTLKLYRAEVTTLDATIGSLDSTASTTYDLDLTATHAAASAAGSYISATPSPATVANLVTVSVTITDAYGNELGGDASGVTVTASVAGTNSATPAMSHIGGGVFSGSYTPANVGTDRITGTLNSQAILKDHDGSSDGTFFLSVKSGPVHHYEVRSLSGSTFASSYSAEAVANFTLAVVATDSLGNTVPTYNATRLLTFSGASASPNGDLPECNSIAFGSPTTLTFSNGVATCDSYLFNAEVSAIDVTDGTLSSTLDSSYDLDIDISQSSTLHYEVTGSSTQAAGSSQVITITAKDSQGNIDTTFAGSRPLTFSGANASPIGNAPTATNQSATPIALGNTTNLTFAAGVATSTLTLYLDEAVSIDVTDGTVSSSANDNWDLDITVSHLNTASPITSTILTSANPAGTCGPLGISVLVRDQYGNQIRNSSATVVITVAGVNPGTPAVTNEGNGSFTAQYLPAAGGADNITATIDGQAVTQDADGIASDGTFQETIDGTGPNVVTWEGDDSNNWHTATNWVGSVPPTTCSDVVIDGAITYQPTLDVSAGSVQVNSVSLGATTSSTLTLSFSSETKALITAANFTIGAHGILTHQNNLDTEVHRLFVEVGGNMSIAAGGSVDVTRKGYDYTTGFNGTGPGGGGGDSRGGWGGTHGGWGGGSWEHDNSAATIYGSIRSPKALGSAGGGGYSLEGGGAIKLTVSGILNVLGDIRADGYSAGAKGGGGAGGSVWLIASTIAGSGDITANGAPARDSAGDLDGSGGGGRVALYYDNTSFSGVVSAYTDSGWDGYPRSGTIFLKQTSAPNGDLVLDAGFKGPYDNDIPIVEDIVVDNLSLINDGELSVESNITVLASTITTNDYNNIRLRDFGVLNLPNISEFSSDTFSGGIMVEREGTLNIGSSTLTLSSWVIFWDFGGPLAFGDSQVVNHLVLEGNARMWIGYEGLRAPRVFSSLTMRNNSVIYNDFEGVDAPLSFILNTLTIEDSAGIWSEGVPYWGPGGGEATGINNATDSASGGGYGGHGGRTEDFPPSPTYGDLTWPLELGSGGGNSEEDSGVGGGAIIFQVSGTAHIDGWLSVEGAVPDNVRGGGSGGSVFIDTQTLTGTGYIGAIGGDCLRQAAGGGGRIAIYYDDYSFTGAIDAQGGTQMDFSTTRYSGGAGTIFLKDKASSYGDLIIDNHFNSGESTPISMNLTVNNLAVLNGAKLVIEEPYTLTVLSPTISTTSDASLTIEHGAQFDAPNLTTLGNFTITNHGSYNHSGDTLTIGQGLTWYENSALQTIGNSQSINNLVINGTLVFGNQDFANTTSFDSIVIHNGGALKAGDISGGYQAPLPIQPVAAYNFEEGAGSNFSDMSENNNDGTLTSTAWSGAGIFGSALSFNGNTSYATVPDSASLDLTTAFTIEAWIYPTSIPDGWATICMKEMTGDLSYTLYLLASGQAQVYGNFDGSPQFVNSPSPVPFNTWTHVAATYDGSILKLYINGSLVGTNEFEASLTPSNRPLRIGGNTIWDEDFAGRIDNIRIYPQALTETQIQLNMATPVVEMPPYVPPTVYPTSLNLEVNSLTIDAGGTIDLNGAGYSYSSGNTGTGPGGGSGNGTTGAGGTHGGQGGDDGASTTGNTNGAVTEPSELGSSGGSCPGYCPGGGALKLTVNDTLLVNGTIRSNGLAPPISGPAPTSDWSITVHGSGAGFFPGEYDSFRYVYWPLNGDGELQAEVSALENSTPDAIAGLMIREDLESDSAFAMVELTPSSGLKFLHRADFFAGLNEVAGPSATAPHWLKIKRQGNLFTVYDSPDGTSWNTIGSTTINMAGSVYFGLAVSSFDYWGRHTAIFKHISSNLPLGSTWTGQHIGHYQGPWEESLGTNTEPYTNPVYPQGGGGAGGSIWINATTLAGSGQITASGADATAHGAGGGGRIAVYYDSNTFNGGVHAYGGNSPVTSGGAGTVYWKGDATPDPFFGETLAADTQGGALIIDNNGVDGETHLIENLNVQSLSLLNSATFFIDSGTTLTLTGNSFITTADANLLDLGAFVAPDLNTISNLETFQIWGILRLSADIWILNTLVHYDRQLGDWQNLANLNIGSGGILELRRWNATERLGLENLIIGSGGLATHIGNGLTQESIVPIRAKNIIIETGGAIDVSGLGYAIGEGPGHPTGLSGAGYGGVGGAGTTGLGGASYGSMTQPLDVGSTALAAYSGGGAVLLEVENTLTVDGEIRAGGGFGPAGSSGGSIFLSADTLSGSGLISANGGDATDLNGGGGAGGRIAIYVFSQTFIPDGGSITAPGIIDDPIGGTGLNQGADGTLYFSFAHHYEVTGLPTQVSGSSQIIDLQIIDNYGQPFYWNFTRPVTFSGPGQANINGALLSPTWTDRDNNPVVLGQPTTFDFTDGATSSSMTLYRVESTSVDVFDGTIDSFGDPAYDLDVTVTAQEATLELGSDINATPSVVEINNSVTVTVTVKDQWGNAKTTGGDTVTLSVAGANPQALSVTDNSDGTYSASYVPTVAGIDSITGTLNTKAITGDLDGLSDGTFYVTVTAGAANHLEITGPANVITGTGSHITIKAVSSVGAVDAAYSGDKQVTLSGAVAGPLGHQPTCRDIDGQDIPFGSPTTLEFVLGQATCQMRLYRVGGAEIDASEGSINSSGNVNWDLNTTVNSLLAEGVTGRISATPNPVERNFAVTIYVATFDTYGNALTSGGQTVTLQVTGVNTNTPAVTDLGDGTYSASYTPTNGGQDLITGTIGGLVITADTDGASDGVFHQTVTATITPTHLEVTGANSQVAGSAQTISITARDNAGDTAFSYSGDKSITLTGPLASLLGTVPTCSDKNGADIALGSVTTLTFTNGQATCSLNLYRVEVTAVDATDGTLSSSGNASWDLDVTVSAGAGVGAASVLSASPNPGELGATVTATLQAKDIYGNIKTTAGDTVTFAVAGANAAPSLSVTYLGSGQYQATYTPSATGLDQITATINTQAVTQDTDGTSDGTFNEDIVGYHLEVTGSATQTAGASQVITVSKRRHDGVLDAGYAGDKAITLSGPSASAGGQVPTCQDQSGVFQPLGNGTTLLFTAGQATCLLTLYHSETVAVDATDGTYSSVNDPGWDLDLVVSSRNGGAIDGTLGASPNPTDRGGPATVEVEATDEYGNDLADDTLVTAVVSGGNNTSLLLTKVAPRLYRGNYLATNAGEDLITATVASQALTKDSDGVSDGVYHLRVRDPRATTHKISGRVYWREPAGEPVKGVIVGDGTHTVLSNSHGNYELNDVADGVYTINGLYEGYQVQVEAGLNPVTVSGSDVSGMDLVVWREAPLTLYAPWNGFLDNVVINEVFNTGSENLQVTINLYKMSGSQVGRGSETRFSVKPREQVDVIVNDLSGFEEDRYGVLVIEMSHGSYSGQVSYYKLTPSGSFRTGDELGEDFDYAFPNPFVAPVTGTSWVTFNTHQPSDNPEEANYLVPNWLTIINGDETKSQYFRIRKYDESGKRIAIPDNTGTVSQLCQARKNELRCRVAALGRIDIDGGHVYPGPERAGLIEIIPENSSEQYVASLVRYGANSPPEIYSNRYSYGASLQARQGLGREQVLTVSSAGDAENWVEIANTLNTSVRAQVEIVDYNGELLMTRSVKIKAYAQVHMNMADILGENRSGVLRVTSDKPGAIVTQSASYYLNNSKELLGVTLTQPQDTFGRRLYGTYNRYLNSYNWLKVVNLARERRVIALKLYHQENEDIYSFTVPGYGGFDLPLHDTERFKLDSNTLGMFELQDSVAGSLNAELLRIKPGPNQVFDFTMSTRLR